jgi:addiction module HigA family antidote
MLMKNPPYPGRSIKDVCLDPFGLIVRKGARVLGVARHTLSRLINAPAWIFPDMAIRFEKMFGYACRRLMNLHRQGVTKTTLM